MFGEAEQAIIATPDDNLATASSTPETSSAANDNPPPEATVDTLLVEAPPEDEPEAEEVFNQEPAAPDEQSAEQPELAPANDNQPAGNLPATGTE